MHILAYEHGISIIIAVRTLLPDFTSFFGDFRIRIQYIDTVSTPYMVELRRQHGGSVVEWVFWATLLGYGTRCERELVGNRKTRNYISGN